MELPDSGQGRAQRENLPREALEDAETAAILDAARLAPSRACKQCWIFIVVKDPVAVA
jgi:nitroreductase